MFAIIKVIGFSLKQYQSSSGSILKAALFMLLSVGMMPIFGYSSVTVMPMEVQLQMPAGASRLTNDIEVYNGGGAVIHVTTSVMDWMMTETGQSRFLEPGTLQRSSAPWIELNPRSFSVPPGKSVRVRYSIVPPKEITEEHWAMVFFQTRAMPIKSSGVGINVSTRIGSKIFITPNTPLTRQGKITDMDVQPISEAELHSAATRAARSRAKAERPDTTEDSLTEKGEAQEAATSPYPNTKVKVVFENTSAMNLRLKGKIEVRGEDGVLVSEGELPNRTQVLSGATRELWAQLDKPLPPGTYRFKAVIDYGAKELMSGELKASAPTQAPATLESSLDSKTPGEAESKAAPLKEFASRVDK